MNKLNEYFFGETPSSGDAFLFYGTIAVVLVNVVIAAVVLIQLTAVY